MKLTVLSTMLILSGISFAQMPVNPGDVEAQEPPVIALLQQYFLKQKNEKLLLEVGDAFFQESRPLHAQYFYKLAKQESGGSEKVEAALKKVEDRLKYLQERFDHFNAEAAKGQDSKSFCSMAAIQFHKGNRVKAMHILRDGLGVFPGDPQISGLSQTFMMGIQQAITSVEGWNKELETAIQEGDVEKASHRTAYILYTSLGNQTGQEAIAKLQEHFPEKIGNYIGQDLAAMIELTDMERM